MVVTGSSPSPAVPVRRRTLVAAVVGAVLAGLLGWLVAPVPSTPGPATSGDPALAERLRSVAGPGQYGLVAAVVTGGEPTVAAIGDGGRGTPLSATTPMEIGSVTKTITGTVLADLERRGEVRADERVRDLVPDRDWRPGGAGDVTLAELASHRSGLPVQAGGWRMLAHNLANTYLGTAPASHTPEQVFDNAEAAEISGRGEERYSNLGVALLGQALAERTGTPYPELVEQVVTGPLGMTATGIPAAPPSGAAVGHDERGRAESAWISPGDSPAGIGVYSTVTDLARYAVAVTDPGSPVADAARPRFPSEFGRIGYGWNVLDVGGHELIWKNGASGGTSSSVLVEPATGRAAVVIGNSFAGVDRIAAELLGVPSPFEARTGEPSGPDVRSMVGSAVGALLPIWGGLTVLVAARGGWLRGGPARRSDVVAQAATGLLLILGGWLVGAVSWTQLPFWLLGCGLAGAGLGVATARWRDRGPDAGPGATARWVSAGVFVVVTVAAVGVVVVTGLPG
ncbi:serine hydrolase domain-containing protein [Pseudonocardia nematodicida]|uniref:Serine hydrolase domain-containing protein n=1 Tax=Pseudonocardia nematodicida TaxID=1206997 RepID=A0ABV1KI02_9PSEU